MDCSGKSNRIIPHLRLEVVTSSLLKLQTVYLSLTSLFEFDLLGRYRSSFELLWNRAKHLAWQRRSQ